MTTRNRINHYTEERHEFGDERPIPTGDVVQVVYKDGHPYGAAFACPCGCPYSDWILIKHPIDPPMAEASYWNYTPGPIFSPSFQRHTPCNSHFNIEVVDGVPGRVRWHAEPNDRPGRLEEAGAV